MKSRKTNNPALFPELRGTLASIRYPAFVEPKRDGEYCVAQVKPDEKATFLINKYGTQRYDCPITYHLAEYAKRTGIENAVFLGELCYMAGFNGDLYKLLSNKTNDNFLKYYIFDVMSLSKEPGNRGNIHELDFLDRREALMEALKDLHSTAVMVNPISLVTCKEDVDKAMEHWTKNGFEGIVIKNMEGELVFGPCGWVKIKSKDRTSYTVCSIDPVKDRLEVIVNFTDSRGNQTSRGVGCKATSKQKQGIKVGDKVIIEHQGLLSAGGLRHPVLIGKE